MPTFPNSASTRTLGATCSSESPRPRCTASMIPRPPGWTSQWSTSAGRARAAQEARRRAGAHARLGDRRQLARDLHVAVGSPVTPKRTCPSVPATWCTAVASDRGTPPGSPSAPTSSAAAQPSPNRAEPTILTFSSPGRRGGQEAADALGGHHQRLAPRAGRAAPGRPAGTAGPRWRSRRRRGGTCRSPGAARAVDEPVGERRPAERVVGGAITTQADLGRVEVELARSPRRPAGRAAPRCRRCAPGAWWRACSGDSSRWRRADARSGRRSPRRRGRRRARAGRSSSSWV